MNAKLHKIIDNIRTFIQKLHLCIHFLRLLRDFVSYIQFPATGFSNVIKGAGTSFGNIQFGSMTNGKVKVAAAKDDFYESETLEF